MNFEVCFTHGKDCKGVVLNAMARRCVLLLLSCCVLSSSAELAPSLSRG